VREDQSRYLVSLQRPGTAEAWSGEVIGRPSLFPLATVNVLTADKSVLVIDKSCRKLWQATLTYNVSGGYRSADAEGALYGQGPCVEHKASLYVIDAGVLTAFDLATGSARWRLPSVGITGLFFDDRGMIYLNTSTASPETLKYPNQIDINRKDSS
jgi:outer membrane protein assembly factor BamB